MIDGKTQEVRVKDSQASRSLGAAWAWARGSALRLIEIITGGAQALPAWSGGLRLARVPVPLRGTHPDRPMGLGASRS